MKKIAILTSGGDASAMNKCLSSFVYFTSKYDLEIYFVYGGYKGLYQDAIFKANYNEVRTWTFLPGTKIYTSRFPKFSDPAVSAVAAENLKRKGIDCLIAIGGDGTYMGAQKLYEQGVNVICLPGTIDNDVASTKYTLGFDTALNTIVNRIKEIRSCMESHRHIALVEIMGRHCVDLTVYAGMATEANILITNENYITPEEFLEKIKKVRKTVNGSILCLVNEKLLGTDGKPTIEEYRDYVEKNSNEQVKINVLGYLQRGGEPTAVELIRCTKMVEKACELISKSEYGKVIGIGPTTNEIEAYDIPEALKMKNPPRIELIKKYTTDN